MNDLHPLIKSFRTDSFLTFLVTIFKNIGSDFSQQFEKQKVSSSFVIFFCWAESRDLKGWVLRTEPWSVELSKIDCNRFYWYPRSLSCERLSQKSRFSWTVLFDGFYYCKSVKMMKFKLIYQRMNVIQSWLLKTSRCVL